jgi:PAS domain S-box-containing protein
MLEPTNRSAEENAALLNSIVESLPFRVYACDAQGRAILQNSVSIQDFGNLMGQTATELDVPPENLRRWQQAMERAMHGEVVWNEMELPTTGGPRHYRCGVAPIRDRGAIRGIVGVDIDITDQVRAQEALRKSEALYRLLAENSSDVISRHKPSGEWLYLSPAARGLMGYDPAELVGRNPFEFIHPEDHGRAQAALIALVTTRQPQSVTFRIRRADGVYLWSETDGRAVVDPQTSELVELVTTSRDVTDRIEATSKLRQREAELAQTGRRSTMGQLATEIAHEMNQPLYAIANFAEASLTLLEQQAAPPGGNLVHWLQQIAQQARRAGDVLRRITQFVQKGELNLAPLDLNEAVQEVLVMLDFEIRPQQVEVKCELAEPLPLVLADRLLIEQVLVNLIRNAVEALADQPAGSRELVVRTEADPGGAIVSVSDSGPGLSEAQLARAFEPYFTTKSSGTGLGLPICRSTVEAHRGRIWARNNPGGGATLEFLLPAAADPASEPH